LSNSSHQFLSQRGPRCQVYHSMSMMTAPLYF
jgi:hypothetical protein